MKLAVLVVVLLSVLILQLGVGAGEVAAHTPKPEHAETTPLIAMTVNHAVGLELTIRLEKARYSLGEPVNITLTLTNICNKTIFMWLISDVAWDYQVFNSSNSLMFDYLSDVFTFGSIGLPVNITAGQSITARFVWPQAYGPIPFDVVTPLSPSVSIGGGINITQVSPGGAIIPVSPGTYYVVGRFSNGTLALTTPPLQIIIEHANHKRAPRNCKDLNTFNLIAYPNLGKIHVCHPTKARSSIELRKLER